MQDVKNIYKHKILPSSRSYLARTGSSGTAVDKSAKSTSVSASETINDCIDKNY